MSAEVIDRLRRAAEEEGGVAFFPPPLILWREFPGAFRVAIYTGLVAERERFFAFSHLSEALALGFRGFDNPMRTRTVDRRRS